MASMSPLGEAATTVRAAVTVELDEEDFGLDILPAEEPPEDQLIRGFSHVHTRTFGDDSTDNYPATSDMGDGEHLRNGAEHASPQSGNLAAAKSSNPIESRNSMGVGAYIQRFRRGANGKMLAAEKSDTLRPGMRLVSINDTSVEYAPFEKIVYMLHHCTRPVRLKFKDESAMEYKDSYQFPCTKTHYFGEKQYIENMGKKWVKRDVLWLDFLRTFGIRQVKSGEIKRCGIFHRKSDLKDPSRLTQYGIMGLSRHPDGYIRFTASVPEEAFQGSDFFVSSSEFSARRSSAFNVLSKPPDTDTENGTSGLSGRDRPSRDSRGSFANSLPSSTATIANNQHHQQHFTPGKVQSLPDLETTKRANSLVECDRKESKCEVIQEVETTEDSRGSEKPSDPSTEVNEVISMHRSNIVSELAFISSTSEIGVIHAYKRIWDVHAIGSPDFAAILREHVNSNHNSSSEFLSKKIDRYGKKKGSQLEKHKRAYKKKAHSVSSFFSRIFLKKKENYFDQFSATDLSYAVGVLGISVSEIRELHTEYKSLIHQGLPAAFRGQIWFSLSGARSKAQLYPEHYFENIVKLGTSYHVYDGILKDVHRTFPGHPYFETLQGQESLARVLTAFAAHNPEIGYTQSINFVAGTLLLFAEEEQAFWILDVIANELLPREYYSGTLFGAQVDGYVFDALLQEFIPSLHTSMKQHEIPSQMVCTEWFIALFTTVMPIGTALRIWDLFFLYGSVVLFRVALAILKSKAEMLRGHAGDFATLYMALRATPSDTFDADWLIRRAIPSISNTSAHIEEGAIPWKELDHDKLARLRASATEQAMERVEKG